MNKIIYIHGAHATPLSFSYIKSHLPAHEYVNFAYSCDGPLTLIVDQLDQFIKQLAEPVYIVAHSLGGVLATLVSHECRNVKKIVSISSPYAGSKSATMLQWLFPNTRLFKDIAPASDFIQSIDLTKGAAPTLAFVTTDGESPMIKEKNDGVVTVESQTALEYAKYHFIHLNHFEVLLSDEVVDTTKQFIFEK